MRENVFFIVGFILALCFISCGNMLSDNNDDDNEGIYIVIDGVDETKSVPVGTDLHLRLSDNSDAAWYVDDYEKATLSQRADTLVPKVILKTKLSGSVKITARVYSTDYHYTLQIVDRIIVENKPKDDFVKVGDTLTVRMDGHTPVKWSVSDASLATFSPDSENSYSQSLTINKAGNGEVTITATDDDGKKYGYAISIANVMLINELEKYKVTVLRDGMSGNEIAEILPHEKWSGYVNPGDKETMFYFLYSALVIDDDDYGKVWLDSEYSNSHKHPIDSIDLETKHTQIPIPSPEYLQFKDTYLKIFNNSNEQFSLIVGNNQQQKTIRNTLYIQPKKTGVYKISSSNIGNLCSNWELKTSSESIPITEFNVQNGGIYECQFDGKNVTPPRNEICDIAID